MALADKDIADLIKVTLDDLGKPKFNQIATRLQNYECFGRALRQDRLKFQGGTGITWNVMTDHNNAARQTQLYGVDNIAVGDVFAQITCPWRHTETHWAWDRREMLMNTGGAEIVDLTKARRMDGMIALVEHLEDQYWDTPTASTDKTEVYGLPHWVVKYTSGSTTGGFNGKNPSGFSDGAGGLSSTANTRWANYTCQYTAVSKGDLLKKMRTAHRKIGFKSPISLNDFRKGSGEQYRIYVNEDTINEMELLGEGQNENLGRDLASMDQQMTFRRNPIVWVPKLDSDSNDPVYMINHGYFYPICLAGDYLRESEPEKQPGQHNVWKIYVDLTWNVLCSDRRRQAVLSTGTDQ